jgi:predicted ATP-grasp superfamily ATP-dependent carboligase
MSNKYNHPALVFGLSETGLAIGRSLGKQGVKVYGVSFFKEIGYYSKYIDARVFSHPEENNDLALGELKSFCESLNEKPVMFIASDVYLMLYAHNQDFFDKYFLHNLPGKDLILGIQDKYTQYKMALKANINVPKTVFTDVNKPIKAQVEGLIYPVFIKARDVNIWRVKVSGSKKGFVIENEEQLIEKLKFFNKQCVPVIIQEIIKSKDDKNIKISVFIDKQGNTKLAFTLKKIHQNPIHFGIAVCAQSIKDEKLLQLGAKLFKAINYIGVGSAEFKYDERDGKTKLIEINSRYWQQNSLADFCGMNFPLMDYLCATNQEVLKIERFDIGKKYLNLFSSYKSFKQYKKVNELTFMGWLKDIRGKKTISFFHLDDPYIIFRTVLRITLRNILIFYRGLKKK